MAKCKTNLAHHSLRLNLNNEQHRRVHMVLADLNTDVHKSVNQFLIDAADAYINALNGDELTNATSWKEKESFYITQADLDKMHEEIKGELQREIIMMLGNALVGAKEFQVPEIPKENIIVDNKEEDDAATDETTVGLASLWG